MSWLSGLFGGGSDANPYKAAMGYLNQIPGVAHQYYDPYIERGNQAMDTLGGAYQDALGGEGAPLPGQLTDYFTQMARDPGAYQSMLGSSFQASPGYQWNVDQQLDAQNRALAAGGMLGSPEHVQLNSQLASNLANQEYDNYFARQLGIAGTGLTGLQNQQNTGLGGFENFSNMGFNANNVLAQSLMDNLVNQARTAAGEAQDRRQRHSGLFGGILGLGGKLLGMPSDKKADTSKRGYASALLTGLGGVL